MSTASEEVAADFQDALQDLKVNSRPEISNLTLIAKENTEHAQAISLVLEKHIRTTRPEWRLPSLYVLDSIVKNVGTPYTVYLGRNLYKTFMEAYLVMDQNTRKAMEGLLRTWKQPVPESMDPRPVFSPEVTSDIEKALNKMRSVQAQQPLSQRGMHSLPTRPNSQAAWGDTPTPPQNGAQYGVPSDPRTRSHTQTPQFGQYSQNQAGVSPTSAQPMGSLDLEELKAEVGKLISTSQQQFALNPTDTVLQQKLQALLALKKILETQTLPPQQLEAVRTQIKALAPPPAPVPASTPMPNFMAPVSMPSVTHTPQPPAFPTIPTPSNAPPPNLAQLLAGVFPQAPTPSNSTPAPTPLMSNLADLLRRIPSPGQSSTPAVQPFYPPPFPVPQAVSTPIPAPATPAQMPALGPSTKPTVNLAELLAGLSKPPAPPQAPVAPPPPALAQLLSQTPPVAASTPHAPPDLGFLMKALNGIPGADGPVGAAHPASEPMSRQPSAPINVLGSVELTTASMKIPRPHLISRLYDAKPNICATCGRRFEATPQGREKKARHMDWHFKMKDSDAAKRGIHRSWYFNEKEWVEYREVDETSPEQPANGSSGTGAVKKQAKDRYVPVPQDAAIAQAPCPICQEKFEPQWLVEANDFVWMDAIHVGGKVYHATCWEEYSKGAGIKNPSTPDSVLGKRKAETGTPASGKKLRG